jgi:hypothetical protein
MVQEDKFKTYYNDLHWSLTEYDRVVMEVCHTSLLYTSWYCLLHTINVVHLSHAATVLLRAPFQVFNVSSSLAQYCLVAPYLRSTTLC